MGIGSWMRGLFRARGSSSGPGGTVVSYWGFGGCGPRRGTPELFRAYRESPWLFAVENRLANERANATKLRLFDGPEDDEVRAQIGREDARYELLRVWRRPTRVATGQIITVRQRVKLLALWFGLAGEGFLVKQRDPRTKRVVGLVPLSPLWVLSTPTVRAPYYVVQVSAEKPPQRIAPHDVIPFVDLDAENPYGRGVGVGMTLADEIDTDEGAAKLAKAELHNMGMPAGMMVLDGASQEDVEKTRSRWLERHQGPEKAGQIEFARGKASFIPLTRSQLFGQSVEQRKFLRDMFIQTHGISPEIFGVLDGSTRDSAYVAYYHLALGALVPWAEVVCDALNAHLVPDFAELEDCCASYVSPIPEDRELKLRCIATAPGAFRGRDARQIGGFAPDSELDDVVLSQNAATATPSQIPPGPANGRLGDPQWALALDRGAMSAVRSKP